MHKINSIYSAINPFFGGVQSHNLIGCHAPHPFLPPLLRRPNILPHPLNPIPQLIDTAIPILEPHPHVINLLHIQHLRLDPTNPRNLRDLVDAALQQPQAQRLHDQNLNLLRPHVRFPTDGRESHGAVVRRAAEDGLGERREGDFLVQEGFVLGEQGALGQVGLEDAVGGQVAAVEGEQEVAEPGVRRGLQGGEDGVQQELAEVVDAVRDEGGDAEVVGAGLGVVRGEGGEVDAGEVEEGVFVVGAEVEGGLVVGGVDAVEGGVDFGFHAVEGVEDGFGGAEVFSGARSVLEAEFDVGGCDEGVDVGVLGGRFVDLFGQVCEEGETLMIVWRGSI